MLGSRLVGKGEEQSRVDGDEVKSSKKSLA